MCGEGEEKRFAVAFSYIGSLSAREARAYGDAYAKALERKGVLHKLVLTVFERGVNTCQQQSEEVLVLC